MTTKDFILKMDKKVQSLSRHYNKKTKCCDRELFIAKIGMKHLKDKYFKLTIKGKVNYVYFPVFSVKQDNSTIYTFCGLQYYLGWNSSKYKLTAITQNDLIDEVFHVNELSDIIFEEISEKEFTKIIQLFKS